MFDAFVTLDSSLRINGGPPRGVAKLQSLLMRSQSMLQVPFVGLIRPEDEHRFRAYMQATQRRDDEQVDRQAVSCHLHLLDRFGFQVAVQLF